jgi:predicted esterase
MEIKEFSIQIVKNARYAMLGNEVNPKNVWVVMHGYGMLSRYFIRKFEDWNLEENLIIAPEGLSKHYLIGFNGRVGATWMTKEDRINEIEDQINFFEDLHKTLIAPIKTPYNLHVLGFSQGATAALRWFIRTKNSLKSVILWGSTFPMDVFNTDDLLKIEKQKILMVFGKKDEFISPSNLITHLDFLHKLKEDIEIIQYNGGHELDKNVLNQIHQKVID